MGLGVLEDLLEAFVDVNLAIRRSGEADGDGTRDGIADANIGGGSTLD